MLSQYILFHYGRPAEVLPFADGPTSGLEYPARYVRACVERHPGPWGRALDLGCAVGGTSFELARYFDEVVGIDLSRRFISAARALQRAGRLPYRRVEAGIVTSDALARVPAEIERSRTRFLIGDATAVPRSLGTFDLVVLANLLDRVGDPARCLAQMRDLVRPGGRLVISSPFTWMTEYTPRSKWLGGVRRGGREVQVHDSLLRLLRSDFALVRRVDVPFTIRDHARKYQWAVADATVWERR
jgi:putative 4-mercaptohistidine N1-methyltranferase